MEGLFTELNQHRAIIHLLLHAGMPALVVVIYKAFFSKIAPYQPVATGSWLSQTLQLPLVIMLLTMVVDVDHLLATPIYAPNRCSIWFHPLHTAWPIFFYGIMLFWPIIKRKTTGFLRVTDKVVAWAGAGLLIHMLLDAIDCLWMRCSG